MGTYGTLEHEYIETVNDKSHNNNDDMSMKYIVIVRTTLTIRSVFKDKLISKINHYWMADCIRYKFVITIKEIQFISIENALSMNDCLILKFITRYTRSIFFTIYSHEEKKTLIFLLLKTHIDTFIEIQRKYSQMKKSMCRFEILNFFYDEKKQCTI